MSYWNGTRWASEEPTPPKRKSGGRRLLGSTLEATLIVALTFGLIAGTALAGKGSGGPKGGRGGDSTLSLTLLAPPEANFGEQVTFEVATTATDQPMVRVDCYQAGTKVYWASAGFYDAYPWAWARNFTLQSTYWTSGAADCTATLYLFDGRRYRDLTSVAFAVGP